MRFAQLGPALALATIASLTTAAAVGRDEARGAETESAALERHGDSADRDNVRTLRFYGIQDVQITLVDNSPQQGDLTKGEFAQGDMVVGSDRLYGRPGGPVVGRAQAVLSVLDARGGGPAGGARNPLFHAVATQVLPGGQIMTQGMFRPALNKPNQVAVVGGTGRYAGARGTLTIRQVDHPKFQFTYDFRLIG